MKKHFILLVFIAFVLISATYAKSSDPGSKTTIGMVIYSISKGARVKICGSCADARGLKNVQLIEGAEISTMDELTKRVVDSDKVIIF